jgi:hypothetical protein
MVSNQRFLEQIDEVISKYPQLQKAFSDEYYYIKGLIDIIDKEGKHWDTYQVEIHNSTDFPYRFPILYEVGGMIPRIADWHIYEDTFACCVKVLPEELIRCRNGITILEYIEEEAIPYLFNQSYRRREGYYVNGEYLHGLMGLYEFYAKELGTKLNIKKTIQLMIFIAEGKKPFRSHTCFCGSGRLFRKCHKEPYEKLSLLGKDIIEDHALKLFNLQKSMEYIL